MLAANEHLVTLGQPARQSDPAAALLRKAGNQGRVTVIGSRGILVVVRDLMRLGDVGAPAIAASAAEEI